MLIGWTKKKGCVSRLENGSEVRIGSMLIYFPPNEITSKNGRLNGHFITSCTTRRRAGCQLYFLARITREVRAPGPVI
jgi:hypothetical protein